MALVYELVEDIEGVDSDGEPFEFPAGRWFRAEDPKDRALIEALPDSFAEVDTQWLEQGSPDPNAIDPDTGLRHAWWL